MKITFNQYIAIQWWDKVLLQVAYTASSSLFGKDKRRFPRFYRLVPITEQISRGHLALIRKLNWKRVMIVSYENEFYLDVCHISFVVPTIFGGKTSLRDINSVFKYVSHICSVIWRITSIWWTLLYTVYHMPQNYKPTKLPKLFKPQKLNPQK